MDISEACSEFPVWHGILDSVHEYSKEAKWEGDQSRRLKHYFPRSVMQAITPSNTTLGRFLSQSAKKLLNPY